VCCENAEKAQNPAKRFNVFLGASMTISERQSQEFKEFERVGWGKQAEHYDSLLAK
jgi:hypothetical protein